MHLNGFQRKVARTNPVYKTLIMDFVDLGFIDPSVGQSLIAGILKAPKEQSAPVAPPKPKQGKNGDE